PGDSRSARPGAGHAADHQTKSVLGLFLQCRGHSLGGTWLSQPGHLRVGDGFVRFDRHRQRAPIAKVERMKDSKLKDQETLQIPRPTAQPRAVGYGFALGNYLELLPWSFKVSCQRNTHAM